MSEAKLGTIGLIHGYGHRAEHWDRLRPELEERGFDTIAVDLPSGDPDATFADYAAVAAEAFRPIIENGGRIDLVPHSMGSQTIPDLVRIVGKDAVRSIIHISGSIGESGNGNGSAETLPTTMKPRIPMQRATDEYANATLRLEGSRMTVLNPSEIRKLMFGDCTPEEFVWALERMRLQAKPRDEPPLEAYRLPGVRQAYLLGDEDMVRDEAYVVEKIAGELGIRLVRMRGGHSPAIARPAELADVITDEIRQIISTEDTIALPRAHMYFDAHPR